MNSITENLYYISDDSKSNQRFIVDIVCKNPDTWQLSKITRRTPFGTCKLGLFKAEFNPNTDFIDFENMEMYADYWDSNIEPEEVVPETSSTDYSCTLSTTSNEIKVNGSYKTITATIIDNNILSDNSSIVELKHWHFYIDDVELIDSELIKVLPTSSPNKIKVKFLGDSSYLTKILTVKCIIPENGIEEDVKLEIISL